MEDSMDIDIDLGEDLEYNHAANAHTMDAAAGAAEHTQPLPTSTAEAQTIPGEEREIPEAYKQDFDADLPAKEKVHLRGLEGVAQPLILDFLAEHVPTEQVKHRRLEWIDDGSLNVIYNSAQDATTALRLLSAEGTELPALELRPAKDFGARPDLKFTLRQALVGDRKAAGAKDRSAFYLFNPEWDPENRRGDTRRGGRGRGGYGGRERRDAPPRRRREPREKVTFTEDMYDDAQPAARDTDEGEMLRRMSTTSLSSGDHARPKRKYDDADLFESKRAVGRLTGRSRSPGRDDGDGRYGFADGDEASMRKAARRRTRSPPGKRRNAGKELFAAAPPATAVRGAEPVELFPDGATAKRNRELFPHHTARSNHRRNDALDKEDTAEIFAQQSRSLAERITGGPAVPSAGAGNSNGNGFSIRGAGDAQPGFSIRGVAAREIGPKVKELFPDRMGGAPKNQGKELFARGGGPRRRAEDMMD